MIEIRKYKPIEQINVWESGVSYQAYNEENNATVELRIFKYNYFSKKQWQQIAKKLFRLYALNSEGVLDLQDMELVEEPFFAVFEFIEKTNVFTEKANEWNIADKLKLISQITNSICDAHRLGIIHEYLSPKTIYVDSKKNIKIDFLHSQCSNKNTKTVETKSFEQLCICPEQTHSSFLDIKADIYSLGMIFSWILIGSEQNFSKQKLHIDLLQEKMIQQQKIKFEPFINIINQCLEKDSSLRPSAPEIKNIIQQLQGLFVEKTQIINKKEDEDFIGTLIEYEDSGSKEVKCIGRFEILEKIGQGGMGVVYKAKDSTDKSIVALKAISPRWSQNKDALRRFYKEARLLSEVNNPYVANMLEVNQADGIHYLAMEFVDGINLEKIIQQQKKVEEKKAIWIIADVVRALVAAHEQDIIHRDIKPANILLSTKNIFESLGTTSVSGKIIAKLSDFGLARHIEENESLELTKSGAIMGTPYYMSPEQCQGKSVDARCDIYSIGATLYHFVTGVPPFEASHAVAIISKHLNEIPVSPKTHSPDLSDSIVHIIEKCMAKNPEERYQDANELLNELDSIIRGEPTQIVIHPQLPSEEKNILKFEYQWNLKSSPKELWSFVTNTERINKAMGLVAPSYFYGKDNKKQRTLFARNKSKMFPLEWEEHPYEWLQEKRMSVLREYNYGLFKWMASIVELQKVDNGTVLKHRFVVAPRGILGRLLLSYQFKKPTFKALDRIYNRIDRFCNKSQVVGDAFENEYDMPSEKKFLLQRLLKKSANKEVSDKVVQTFQNFLERAPEQEVTRIRPLSLAKRLEIDHNELIVLCLNAAKEGVLALLWDIICPLCRIPSELKDTLKELKTHGHCEACNINYELDFANSVELIFRVRSTIRQGDIKVYCIGGPTHSPHVISQVKLKPKECIDLNLKLVEGAYILRSKQLPKTHKFHVSPHAALRRWNLQTSDLQKEEEHIIKTENQHINILNDFDKEVVIRLEHTVSRQNVLTAAYVSSLPLFRKLFPQEVLSPEQLISISNIVLFAVNISSPEQVYKNNNDNEAFNILYTYYQTLEEYVKEYSGSLIKTIDEGIIATFQNPAEAVQAGIQLQKKIRTISEIKHLDIRVAIHKGPAMVATINDRLDYFGATIKAISYLLYACQKDEVVFSQSIAMETEVSIIMKKYNITGKTHKISIPNILDRYIIKAKLMDS